MTPVDPVLETLWDHLLRALDDTPTEASAVYVPEGAALPFVCLGTGARPAARSAGGVSRDGERLFFAAAMEKEAPRNAARSGREKTWMTGDVFEVFFQPPGSAAYYEIHATPEAVMLRLRLPGVGRFGNRTFEELLDDDLPARVYSRIPSASGRWLAAVELSWRELAVSGLSGARFALCRYDYPAAGGAPEISAVRHFPATFHDPERWIAFA